MHRSFASALALAATAATLAACADAPSAPRTAGRQPSAAAYAGDNRVYNDVRVTVGMPIRVPCGRMGMEIVPLSGVEHASLQFVQTATGATSLRMHVNAQGVTGVGLVSGDLYRASGTTEETYDFASLGPLESYYLTYTFNVTSAGATGNIVAHELLRMSFDAEGNPSLDVVKFDGECR
jgi:hypothetical protein